MCKSRRFWLLLIGLVGVAIAVYFEPTRCVRGWLWGEAFFDGRPTSWWREVVMDEFDKSSPTALDELCKKFGYEKRMERSIDLVRSRDAGGVLREMTGDSDRRVARFSQVILGFHRSGVIEDDLSCRLVWRILLAEEAIYSNKDFN